MKVKIAPAGAGVDGKMLLKWILKIRVVRVWPRFICIRIGPRGGLL